VALPIAFWIPIGLGAVLLGGVYYVRHKESRTIRQRIWLSHDSIYSTYYASSDLPKEDVIEIWCEIASALNIPEGKLRPQDRFAKDIGRYLITSEELDTLSEHGRKRATELGISVDLSNIRTVDEYVRAFARKSQRWS
jgi:hypothetical protein